MMTLMIFCEYLLNYQSYNYFNNLKIHVFSNFNIINKDNLYEFLSKIICKSIIILLLFVTINIIITSLKDSKI